jgi:serine/threonine protein kinase
MKKKFNTWDDCYNLKEVKALIGLNHANIVKLIELIYTKGYLYMIFEYVGQNLYENSIKPNKDLNETKIRNIIFQVLQGLAHMHKLNFFHRDLKPENILVEDDIVKIADFGLAKEIRSVPPYTEYVATRWYRSPEVILKSKNYNSPIDVFAVGAIMAELYMCKPLFPGKNEYDQMNKICEVLGTPSQHDWTEGYILSSKINYKFPTHKGLHLSSIITKANPKAINLMEKMLNFNPLKRPSPAECLQHPYFQCFDLLYLYGLKMNPIASNSFNTNRQSQNNIANSTSSTSELMINTTQTTFTGQLHLDNSRSILTNPVRVSSTMGLLPSTTKSKKNSTSKISKFKFDDIYNLK